MNNFPTLEIIALAVGLIVIVIETIIIFMLRKHTKTLESHLNRFQKTINDHLSHLNEHSHDIEEMLKKLKK